MIMFMEIRQPLEINNKTLNIVHTARFAIFIPSQFLSLVVLTSMFSIVTVCRAHLIVWWVTVCRRQTMIDGPLGCLYTVIHKNVPLNFCLYLCQLLTDFKNSFPGTLCIYLSFCHYWMTLPCDMGCGTGIGIFHINTDCESYSGQCEWINFDCCNTHNRMKDCWTPGVCLTVSK